MSNAQSVTNIAKKTLIIGIGLMTIAAGTYLITEPRKGSVEWHKQKYLAAANGSPLSEMRNRIAARLRGKRYVPQLSSDRSGRIERHQQALLELGFLEERRIVPTNFMYAPHRIDQWQWHVLWMARHDIPDERLIFPRFRDNGGGTVRVIAPREDMPAIERAIQTCHIKEGRE